MYVLILGGNAKQEALLSLQQLSRDRGSDSGTELLGSHL